MLVQLKLHFHYVGLKTCLLNTFSYLEWNCARLSLNVFMASLLLYQPFTIKSNILIIMFTIYRLKEEYRALEERNLILNHSLEARMLQGDSESLSIELSECRVQRDQIFQNVSWCFCSYCFNYYVQFCVQHCNFDIYEDFLKLWREILCFCEAVFFI